MNVPGIDSNNGKIVYTIDEISLLMKFLNVHKKLAILLVPDYYIT